MLNSDCCFVFDVNFIYIVIVILVLGFGKNFFLFSDILLLENILINLYVCGNVVICVFFSVLLLVLLEVFNMFRFEYWLKGKWRVMWFVVGGIIGVWVGVFVGVVGVMGGGVW